MEIDILATLVENFEKCPPPPLDRFLDTRLLKNDVAKKNNFKMKDLKNLVRESLSLITPQNWLEAVRHAEKLQDEDGKRDIATEKFI